jgi:hypothetical protein
MPWQQRDRPDDPMLPQLVWQSTDQGAEHDQAQNTARSGHDRRGLPTWRHSTATSWRSNSRSAAITVSPRATCRNQPKIRTGRRCPYPSRSRPTIATLADLAAVPEAPGVVDQRRVQAAAASGTAASPFSDGTAG